jgi:hypothetical protein
MEILGFQFELPRGLRVERTVAGESIRIEIVGKNAGSLSAAIVERAVAAGFSESEREGNRIALARDEQWLILVHVHEGLIIHTYDPTTLPRARFDGSAVLLDDLKFECGACSIEPLRERYLDDKHLRRG